jgi:hypothetical protein
MTEAGSWNSRIHTRGTVADWAADVLGCFPDASLIAVPTTQVSGRRCGGVALAISGIILTFARQPQPMLSASGRFVIISTARSITTPI